MLMIGMGKGLVSSQMDLGMMSTMGTRKLDTSKLDGMSPSFVLSFFLDPCLLST